MDAVLGIWLLIIRVRPHLELVSNKLVCRMNINGVEDEFNDVEDEFNDVEDELLMVQQGTYRRRRSH